jgi:hypothetical protein
MAWWISSKRFRSCEVVGGHVRCNDSAKALALRQPTVDACGGSVYHYSSVARRYTEPHFYLVISTTHFYLQTISQPTDSGLRIKRICPQAALAHHGTIHQPNVSRSTVLVVVETPSSHYTAIARNSSGLTESNHGPLNPTSNRAVIG